MDLQKRSNVEHSHVESKANTSFVTNDAMLETRRYTLSDLHPVARLSQKMAQTLSVKDHFTVELITESDSEEVLEFLKKFFFQDEPLNTSIELGDCKELEDYSLKCVPEHCSFKAVNTENQIIGVFLNGLIKKTSPGEVVTTLADKCEHKKFRKILTLMDYIDTKFNIFDLYPNADTVLDGKIVSVDTNYRGLGIAGKLTEKTLEYMKEKSIPVMHVLCTSHFSARVLEKLDFHQVYQLSYADYSIENNTVLKPAEPHVAATILVKEVK